jgi:aminoglycoside phosphotransferase (APT) family kinase protein
MTPAGQPAEPRAGFAAASEHAARDAAGQAGLDSRGCRLIRRFGSAVYHLPAAEAVARVAQLKLPDTAARLAASVQVTRWLTETGFPCVEPLSVTQPVTSHGCVVTFWRYLPQDGPGPGPGPGAADLGRLLRQLHKLGAPPVVLPAYRPLTSVLQAASASLAIDAGQRAWLADRGRQLLAAYDDLCFQLPAGMIHADAWLGNLLRAGDRVVLADWDNVSAGPREIDLIPTMQAVRFGLSDDQRDAFAAACPAAFLVMT